MARYHISPESGEPRKCSAKIECKFSNHNGGKGVAHYENKEEAMKAWEKTLANTNETFTEMKKPTKAKEYLPSKSEIRKLRSLNRKSNTAKNFEAEEIHREQLNSHIDELLEKGTNADYIIGVMDGTVEPRYESNVKTQTASDGAGNRGGGNRKPPAPSEAAEHPEDDDNAKKHAPIEEIEHSITNGLNGYFEQYETNVGEDGKPYNVIDRKKMVNSIFNQNDKYRINDDLKKNIETVLEKYGAFDNDNYTLKKAEPYMPSLNFDNEGNDITDYDDGKKYDDDEYFEEISFDGDMEKMYKELRNLYETNKNNFGDIGEYKDPWNVRPEDDGIWGQQK